jgi:glycosyltransferase involved in cell wall biosynthesis
MRRLVAEHVATGDYDLVYTHTFRPAEFTRNLELPKVLGAQISQGLNLRRMVEHTADPFRRLFYRIERDKAARYEAEVCADYDRVFLCGPSDVAAIEETAPLPNAVICPHGQDVPPLDRVRAAAREPGAIVITGVMSTYTNVDGATWFAREILPRVRREVPEAHFWIVGRAPQRSVRALGREPHIEVTGEVPDVYDWLSRAELAVAPIRIGAGMQNKVVQAMACELAVVATPVANEGIGAKDGEEIAIAGDAASFAAAVVRLLRDTTLRRSMGEAARSLVESQWTWEASFARLEKVLRDVVDERGQEADPRFGSGS